MSEVCVPASLHSLRCLNEGASFMEGRSSWQRAGMRCANLNVDVFVSLLEIKKIDVRMPRIGDKFGGVLFDVNRALHAIFYQTCQAVSASVVAFDNVATKLT